MTELDAGAVAGAFGLGRPLAPPTFVARGAMGAVFRLDTTAGSFAVKQAFTWTPEPTDDVEFQFAVSNAGVRIPRPVLAAGGAVAVDGARVYEWLDMAPIDDRPAPPADLREVASALRMIHDLAWPAVGEPDGWYTEPVGAERWDQVLRTATDSGASWVGPLNDMRADLLVLDEIVAAAPTLPLVRCHLDYNRSNVGRSAAGELVVLDWENSGPGVAVREAAGALLDWATGPDRRPDRAAVATFLSAYGGLPDGAVDLTIFAPRSAGWCHYLAQVCALAPDPATPDEHRRFWAADAEAMLQRPLTVANLEEMLAAIHAVGSR